MNKVLCQLLEFGSDDYKKSIDLRRKVLRTPLGLDFTANDLSAELDQFHFALFYNNQLVGILLLKTINPSVLKMRQVAIDPDYQSNGLGSILVKYSEEWAFSNGNQTIELNARKTAVSFYLNLNYQETGNEFFEVNIPHIKMIKNL
jgi:predicted GNAT family N-acyltransferase